MATAYSLFCLFAIFFIVFSPTRISVECAKNTSIDQFSLLSLKTQLSSTYQNNVLISNWSINIYVCHWIGVTCGSQHNRVVALDISDMGLIGQLPPSLGNLSFLHLLNMSHNNLYGNLPKELAHLRRLRDLDLRHNNLCGEIPSQLGDNLLNLEVIDIGFNQFSGSIPKSILNISTLEILYFAHNNLSGTLPTTICHYLPNLKGIHLAKNNLNGRLPANLSACSKLRWLGLTYNMFSGYLPGDIGKLEMLEIIALGGNNFAGEIPPGVGHLHNLKDMGIEGNRIAGSLPAAIFNISSLQSLRLQRNQLTGSIPWKIGNLTSLQVLALYENYFTGMIPQEITNLKELQVLVLRSNNLNGLIPQVLFNITTLRSFDLSMNHIYATLPSTFGNSLPNLEVLILNGVKLSGSSIPQSIGNCSKLRSISLGQNQLNGHIPNSLGDLSFLTYLSITANNLSSEPSSSQEVSLITSLTKCRNLIDLDLSETFLDGILPKSVGNLSSSLENFFAMGCFLRGAIPKEIGNLSSLIAIDFSSNDLEGIIVLHTLKGLERLQRLRLGSNKLSQPISHLCVLKSLGEIFLSSNRISGPLPECIANLTSLRYIYLDHNRMVGGIPSNLWNMKDLLVLNLSSNSFTGPLPSNTGNLKAIILVDLSNNKLFGSIPSTIGQLQNVLILSLAQNNLYGQIPNSIGQMVSLQSLDLSHNNLSGLIPKSLEGIRYLDRFNVSFNNLEGEIPSNGSFRNFSSLSFLFNEALCGAPRFHVPPCNPSSLAQNGCKKAQRYILMGLGIMGCMLVLVVGSMMMILRRKKKITKQGDLLHVKEVERISYYELLHATRGYSESALLGEGSFGVVYKGVLNDGRNVAIKVFNEQQEGAFQSFDVECEILCNIRHRNLTKVLTSCSNQDFKALVIEYMPNGSFEKWLYSENCFLNLMQRLNIMIDVACALEYLHHGCLNPIVHCDLKPSNVLLDEEMVAHVCDFGIAKLLCGDDSITYTRTLATLGYIAPEYGSEGQVSTRSDVYSYGIMLMEAFTRKKPSTEMFIEHMSLRSWVKDSLPERLIDILDANLLALEENHISEKMEYLSSIMELALKCSAESPIERVDIKEVLVALQKIKLKLE